MQNTTFNLLGVGYSNFYQAKVQIYHQNCLIDEGFTHNGKITFCLEKNKAYKVISTLLNKRVVTIIYVNNNNYTINLNEYNNNRKRVITFLLTDFYYENLKIEKGELTFG